jgi:hypothetical protein
MSKPNTVHPTHEDANGLGTHVCMLDGFKFWLYGLRRHNHDSGFPLSIPAPGPGKTDWHFAKFAGYYPMGVVLGVVGGSDHL